MKYTVEKRKVKRTGSSCLGWAVGHGFIRRDVTVEKAVWCVLNDGRVFAEFRSKKDADIACDALLAVE